MATPTVHPPHEPEQISLNYDFENKPFVLTGESLQKIHDLILTRVSGEILFEIGYSDGSVARKLPLQKVLADENSKRRAISSLECVFRSHRADPSRDRISISFNGRRYSHVLLRATSPDRDRIWLTFEDLKGLLSDSVIRSPRVSDQFQTVVMLVLTAGFFVWLWWRDTALKNASVRHPTLAEAVQSADPVVKLNYLLSEKLAANQGFDWPSLLWLLLYLAIVMLFMVLASSGQILPASVFPHSHFVIGAGALRYHQQERLKSQLFWSVLVAVFVSVVAGFFSSSVLRIP